MNAIYGFFQRLLVEMLMLLSVGVLFLAALVASVFLPLLDGVLAPIPHGRDVLLGLAEWILPSLLLLGGFFGLYKFVPRHRCNWQSCLLAALAATVGCYAARPRFTVYVGKLASYSEIYGWLTIGILFMIWAEVISVITIFCGELASHIQMMAFDGLSGQEVSRRHCLRSPGRSVEREKNGTS